VSLKRDKKIVCNNRTIFKPLILGFAFGAAFLIFGEAMAGKFSISSALGRNGSTVVKVFSIVDG
jgi:hypothetical protein